MPELHMDLEVLLRQVSKDLPLFLYGHALGGLLIITLIIRNPALKTAGDININININGLKYWLIKLFGHYLEVIIVVY